MAQNQDSIQGNTWDMGDQEADEANNECES
jgi:hypothetical protein